MKGKEDLQDVDVDNIKMRIKNGLGGYGLDSVTQDETNGGLLLTL
jgi:hypothetical protein